MAATLVGPGKLVDPSRLAHIFSSPRKRARTTFEILRLPPSFSTDGGTVTYTEDIAEWDYGDYEGLKTEDIRKVRKERGLDQEGEWNIWRDGCEGGEYVILNFHSLPRPAVIDGLLLGLFLLSLTYRTDPCSMSPSAWTDLSHKFETSSSLT